MSRAPAFVVVLTLLLPADADAQPTPPPAPLTVVVDVRAEDARGRPVTALGARDIELRQEGVVQRDVTFRALSMPGLHELSYAPASGRAGALTLRPLRPGLTIGAPDGQALRPRVVAAETALEAELARLLDAAPTAGPLETRAGGLCFDAGPQGVRCSLLVETPLRDLALQRDAGLKLARVQVLARVKDAGGAEVARVAGERAVPVAGAVSPQRLVWTGVARVPPGRHTLETVVRDAATGRAGVSQAPLEVPAVGPGPRLSSVTLLQPAGSQRLLTDAQEADDPLFFAGIALMPALDLELPLGSDVPLEFFVVLYPDPARPAPTLRAELWRDGRALGQVDLKLPAPDAQGALAYSGRMPTRSFADAAYTLRVVATQGDAQAASEAGFRMRVPEPPAPVRVEPR